MQSTKARTRTLPLLFSLITIVQMFSSPYLCRYSRRSSWGCVVKAMPKGTEVPTMILKKTKLTPGTWPPSSFCIFLPSPLYEVKILRKTFRAASAVDTPARKLHCLSGRRVLQGITSNALKIFDYDFSFFPRSWLASARARPPSRHRGWKIPGSGCALWLVRTNGS